MENALVGGEGLSDWSVIGRSVGMSRFERVFRARFGMNGGTGET